MADDARWNSWALRLVLGLTTLRLLWHLLTPIGLLGDEAYYWEWGRHLDWGYFSKPPLIAWLYGGLGRLTADSLYAFKTTATLLTGGGLWFFFLAVRRALDSRIAFWALAAAALSIGNTLLASILTIDAPLLFFWCLALYLYFRILFAEGRPAGRDVALLTVALGLGHLSKQMMLAFLPLMLVGAWFAKRELLRTPHLYLAALLSLLFLLPPLLWNMAHDWITVSHTGHHFEAEEFDPGEVAVRYAALFGITAVLLTPILFVLMLGATWSMRRWTAQPPATRVLFFFGAAALLGIGLLALRQEINPNWPAVFYPAAIAMTAWWCFRDGHAGLAAWFRRSVALGAVLTLALMALLPFIDQLGFPAQRRGWRGYPELANAVASHAGALTARGDFDLYKDHIIFDGHRFTCSQLSYQLRSLGPHGKRICFLWPDSTEVNSQHDLWGGPTLGTDALVVVERKNAKRTGEPNGHLVAAFDDLELLTEIPLHHSRDYPTFKLYFARNLKHWPDLLADPESK